MKQAKKLVSLLMALSMVFSLLAVSASAATPPDDPGISPLGIIESRPYNLNPYDISQSIPFVVGKNFTFWKIHIRTTNPNLQFTISKDSPSGPTVYYSAQAGYGTCIPTGGQAYYGQLAEGTYYINVTNPDNVEKGIKSITVDGTPIKGCIIPYIKGKTSYDVKVIMGN